MDYLLILGNRIRERRTALGISQAELAEAGLLVEVTGFELAWLGAPYAQMPENRAFLFS